MRWDLWASERAKAEVDPETGLKILREGPSQTGQWFAKIWNPKATKPYANYSFKSVERREQYIAEQVAAHKSWQARKVSRKAERAGSAADLDAVKIGDIFCHSWGYDQTNIDFYQVVEKNGRSVTVKEIGGSAVPGSDGFMSNRVKPKKGAFRENAKPIKKLVQFSGGKPYLSFEYGWCGKAGENEDHYQSWYA